MTEVTKLLLQHGVLGILCVLCVAALVKTYFDRERDKREYMTEIKTLYGQHKAEVNGLLERYMAHTEKTNSKISELLTNLNAVLEALRRRRGG